MQQEHGENPGKRNMVKNYRKKSKLHRYNRNQHLENTEENVTESVINDNETNKNVVNLPENVSKPEESVSEQGENVPEEQIPGQDDIMNHPEYLPEKKTDKQIIEDAKRTVEAIRLTLNDWEYTIPQGMLAAILDRVEYLKDTLQELVKGDADEDDV